MFYLSCLGALLCQVFKTQKLLDWGFQMSLGLEESPLWVSTESIDPSRLMQSLTVSSFIEEKWSLWMDLRLERGIRAAGCVGTVGKQGVFLYNTISLYFLFQHLHWETPDHTFSQHLLNPWSANLDPMWPVKVLLSHLVHLTWDHFKHDPDFTLSFHIQVFANSGIQYCVGTLLRCLAIHILSLSPIPLPLGLQDTSELLDGVYNCLYVARASLNAKCHQQV